MLGSIRTFTIVGVDAHEVRVEADVSSGGLPSFALVGLPDAAVRESRERVRAAIANSGFAFPKTRITANLAPADLRKAGPGFDLAIAAAVLVASEQLHAARLEGIVLAGELALDGSIRPIPGAYAIAQAAAQRGAEAIAVAEASAPEAGLAGGVRVVPVATLAELEALGTDAEPGPPEPLRVEGNGSAPSLPDLADLRGQAYLRRVLELAAAGGHSLLMTGPPGAGKSMAATRLPSLLPPLDDAEAGEAIRIASACGRPIGPLLARRRPYRAPHHTISTAGLVGGGSPPRPGEVTLAHRGVLFLDELAEFRRDALEALRQPVEEGRVTIARASRVLELPCRFQLVAAANPCPCGRGEGSPDCDCPPQSVRRYSAKLSGALADRVDILIAVGQPDAKALSGPAGEPSARVRERVIEARGRQRRRLGAGRSNAEMTPAEARRWCAPDSASEPLLAELVAGGELSGRGHHRSLRLARTIADLAGRERIAADDLAEALALRRRGSP
ncbi:MAG TPA: YifB family Mg chelatase-like AAA ATPase [Solirubrobacterales bacterium]|nr:YifB family Mg chelatase-like AAA ATPase [Solirubrobacterales bacterium]